MSEPGFDPTRSSEKNEISVEGEVLRVTFDNPDTGFRVFRLGVKEAKEPLVVVGRLPRVAPGIRVRVTGQMDQDPKHGSQLRARSLIELSPETLVGVERYLASGLIAGVGPKYAKRIVACFGISTLAVLDEEPNRLAEVPGLGKRRIEQIRESWIRERSNRDVTVFLQSHGVTPAMAARIQKRFGQDTARIVKEDPYRLSLDVWGIGFRSADRIATELGIDRASPARHAAALVHVLRTESEIGHVYIERDTLDRHIDALLDGQCLGSALEQAAADLELSRHIVLENGNVFLTELHQAESDLAHWFTIRAKQSFESTKPASLITFERERQVTLAPEQHAAVELSANHGVSVVTGGPGVGKTTIVRALLFVFGRAKNVVRLAAPTGRAAKRMSEACGQDATTIHRLLEFDPRARAFVRDENNPIEGDVLIVDEFSMVDILLARALFRAVPPKMRVVIVGDVDQLASVGPGAVLRDVLASHVVPSVRLVKIFRQAESSGIIENAHRINRGEWPESLPDDQEFFVLERKDSESAERTIAELVTSRIPKRFGLDPVRDIQVLTPMHKGPAGSVVLNRSLQSLLVGDAGGAALFGFRVGDKVMQLKNDYDRNVWNGDIGIVESASSDTLHVRYDEDRLVAYERAASEALTLAYACSIHKSQGSEYPCVIVVMTSSHYVMLSRNLLYTAVTRGRRLVVLVTDSRALRRALSQVVGDQRRTRLAQRLREAPPGARAS